MKVQYIKEKVFTPVNLHITFETEEEYRVFNEMIKLNVTIPDMLYEVDALDGRFILLQKIMNELHNAIRDPLER